MNVLLTNRQKHLHARLRVANIHEKSFLATDYLNNFNEVIMIIEMLADMPDMLEDARQWQHKSYVQHFTDSGFSEKVLAIEAYHCAPHCYRQPFDALVTTLDTLILGTISEVAAFIDNEQATRAYLEKPLTDIKILLSSLNAVIHGVIVKPSDTQINPYHSTVATKENQRRIDIFFDQAPHGEQSA